jgi:hypothetical protein
MREPDVHLQVVTAAVLPTRTAPIPKHTAANNDNIAGAAAKYRNDNPTPTTCNPHKAHAIARASATPRHAIRPRNHISQASKT